MRQFKITVNGKSYDVQVEENGTAQQVTQAVPVATSTAPVSTAAPTVSESTAQVQEAAPAAVAAPAGEGTPIEAPMPGTILKVLVTAGQAVKSGDTVVILEAMKMENEITAPSDGTVTAVCVNQGDTVDAGKVIITIK